MSDVLRKEVTKMKVTMTKILTSTVGEGAEG